VQCPQKLFVAPAADTGLRIRGDVRAVEGPKGRRERSTAGKGLPAMLAISVAGRAVGGVREIGAAGNLVRIGGDRRRRREQAGGERCS